MKKFLSGLIVVAFLPLLIAACEKDIPPADAIYTGSGSAVGALPPDASVQAKENAIKACSAYAMALDIAADFRATGDIGPEVVVRIDNLRQEATPMCSGEEPPDVPRLEEIAQSLSDIIVREVAYRESKA